MAKKKSLDEGYQPVKRGYVPDGEKVQGGYKPNKSEAKPAPNPPPKKP